MGARHPPPPGAGGRTSWWATSTRPRPRYAGRWRRTAPSCSSTRGADETDTELALRAALERGAEEIYLLGALGGRLDHSLANLLLLALPELEGVRVTILAGRQRALAVRGQAEIRGRPGDLVSLVPIGGDAEGIWTTGLEYPLQGGTLRLGAARGISNVLTAPLATVRVERGILLAVVTASGG